jgi:hypothetical protein
MPKNFGGGKVFKKQGSKDRRGEKQNQEITAAFVDDILSGEIPTEVVIARVTRMLGGGRISLLLPDGSTKDAAIRGTLSMSKGAARAPGNILTISVNSFIMLQLTDYGPQVVGLLTRGQVEQIKGKITVSSAFFAVGDVTGQDDGYDFIEDEEAGVEAPEHVSKRDKPDHRAPKGEDKDVDIEKI